MGPYKNIIVLDFKFSWHSLITLSTKAANKIEVITIDFSYNQNKYLVKHSQRYKS